MASRNPSSRKPRLTHPEKRLFDDPPLDKGDLARHYTLVAPRLLADAGRRPLSVVRCPEGVAGDCFYQKHVGRSVPDAVHGIDIREKSGETEPYLWIDDEAGLLALVQMDVIELHAWGSTVDDIEHPDRVVFDLDPGEGVAWRDVKAAARLLRRRLQALGLQPLPRTTGGKGLHVVAPIERGPGWRQVLDFAHGIASTLEREQPRKYLARSDKSLRGGRIFIDYLRNSRGATAIANYSVRARRGAGVATPLRWDELARLRAANQYTVLNLPRRLAQQSVDPWHDIDKLRRPLPNLPE
jgi:bifunctional non-homologous end joining protein LigD